MRSAARKQSRFDQLEFCFKPGETCLPSRAELQARAISLLKSIGAAQIGRRLRVQWNQRMRTAVGRAEFRGMRICLNPLLQQFGAAEIDRTLRHELAHLLAQYRAGRGRILPHGPEWQRACRDLGLPGERACHRLPLPTPQLPRRLLYRCRNCGRQFPRVRRIRRATACLGCCRRFARGHYDERFHLQLVKN